MAPRCTRNGPSTPAACIASRRLGQARSGFQGYHKTTTGKPSLASLSNHSGTWKMRHQNQQSHKMRPKAQTFSRLVVQVPRHLDVSQALIDKELKSYFFPMQRVQTGYYTKKIYIRVGGKNCVWEAALKIKLNSSGIGPFMEVEGIPYPTTSGPRYSKTNKFVRRRAMKTTRCCGFQFKTWKPGQAKDGRYGSNFKTWRPWQAKDGSYGYLSSKVE